MCSDKITQLQRPRYKVEGLRAAPWWNPAEFSFLQNIEECFPAIRDEFYNLLICGRLNMHPQSPGGPRPKATSGGDWQVFELFSYGRINRENAMEAPATSKVIVSIPQVVEQASGLVYFSVLGPHGHISPHCGLTNARLRVHLGIRVPDGAVMRVGTEARSWSEGRCLVFDDSWEHEVWNPTDTLRAVLLLDIVHPDLFGKGAVNVSLPPSTSRDPDVHRRAGWRNRINDSQLIEDQYRDNRTRAQRILGAIPARQLATYKRLAHQFSNCDNWFVSATCRFILSLLSPSSNGARSDFRVALLDEALSSLAALQADASVNLTHNETIYMLHMCALSARTMILSEPTGNERLTESQRKHLSATCAHARSPWEIFDCARLDEMELLDSSLSTIIAAIVVSLGMKGTYA